MSSVLDAHTNTNTDTDKDTDTDTDTDARQLAAFLVQDDGLWHLKLAQKVHAFSYNAAAAAAAAASWEIVNYLACRQEDDVKAAPE